MDERPRTLVIVNPASAGGSTERRWPGIRDTLSRYVDFDVAISEYPGHAIRLGQMGREAGFTRLICVGGDGTINEVVNGALSGDPAHLLPEIGTIPSGTGSDLARTLGIPRAIEEACFLLGNPRRATSDLGVVSYKGREGPERRCFVNAAGLGYDAEVVLRRNGFNRYVRGTLPYLASVTATLLGYRNKDVTVTIDKIRDRWRMNTLVVAIGKFFGGGMRIAPDAVLGDGFFDLILIGDVSRLELAYNLPRVYKGTHLQHPKVSARKARVVSVEADVPVRIQADGDLLGFVPARFQIIPGALTLLC